jgi:hypothetical protein
MICRNLNGFHTYYEMRKVCMRDGSGYPPAVKRSENFRGVAADSPAPKEGDE